MMKVVTQNLIKLDSRKQVAFGWLAAIRFFNGYEIFSKESGFGSVSLMNETLTFSHEYIVNASFNESDGSKLLERVDKAIPDMDDFGYPINSAALNVGVMIYETLNIIIGNTKYQSVKSISTAATDNVDMIIQVSEGWEYNDEGFEQKVLRHPLMEEEISIQNGIIVYLEKIDTVEERDLLILEEMQNNRFYQKLDLRTALVE